MIELELERDTNGDGDEGGDAGDEGGDGGGAAGAGAGDYQPFQPPEDLVVIFSQVLRVPLPSPLAHLITATLISALLFRMLSLSFPFSISKTFTG